MNSGPTTTTNNPPPPISTHTPALARSELSDDDVRTAIKNSGGIKGTLLIPEAPFELLVRRAIERLLPPALQAKEFVHGELLRIAAQCAPPDAARFPVLQVRLAGWGGGFLSVVDSSGRAFSGRRGWGAGAEAGGWRASTSIIPERAASHESMEPPAGVCANLSQHTTPAPFSSSRSRLPTLPTNLTDGACGGCGGVCGQGGAPRGGDAAGAGGLRARLHQHLTPRVHRREPRHRAGERSAQRAQCSGRGRSGGAAGSACAADDGLCCVIHGRQRALLVAENNV